MDSFEINNVQSQERPVFDRRGNVRSQVEYSFFVGQHGPFTLRYAHGEDKPERVQADMTAQVQKLQAILGTSGRGG